MRIVILINQSKQALMAEISQSRLKHWLKRASLETLETSDVWSKLYHAFGWSDDQSLAHALAGQSGIKGSCLIATPVKVVLGMRDSESHSLSEGDSLITKAQLQDFNGFFDGVSKLHAFNGQHYLLEFEGHSAFHLEKHYWLPYLNDYRVQVQAAQDELVRHLTEMQAWCHQQDSVWNALYLWSNSGAVPLPTVWVDDRTEHGMFALLKLLSHAGHSASNDKIIAVDDLNNLEQTLFELEAECKSGQIEEVTVSFTGKEIYQLNSDHLRSWWSKIFRF